MERPCVYPAGSKPIQRQFGADDLPTMSRDGLVCLSSLEYHRRRFTFKSNIASDDDDEKIHFNKSDCCPPARERPPTPSIVVVLPEAYSCKSARWNGGQQALVSGVVYELYNRWRWAWAAVANRS